MAQSIKNLIFGSDLPIYVKRKIEARQRLSEGDISPNESITSKYTKEGVVDSYPIEDVLGIGGMPTDGIADNASRTPVARMWCAVNISENTKLEELNSEQEVAKFWEEKIRGDYDDSEVYLKKIRKNHWEKRQWKKLGNSTKFYVVGNHIYNTFAIEPNQQKTTAASDTEGQEVVSADVMKVVAPFEGETDLNKFLKPSAGITSITSETETNLGAIKRTTVNFVVHNVDDFNKIYMKYFMKPGATIFVDFGYSTGAIYDVEELMNEVDIEDKLYGDTGYVPQSNGDLDVVYGNVVNYTATVRDDGGFDCMIEIISKNMALMSNALEDSFKNKAEDGLDTEILGFVTAGVFGDPMLYYYARQWGQNVENEAQLKAELARAAMDALGGRYVQFPGETGTQSEGSRMSSKWGVFIRGTEESYIPYVSWGWFEDHILNSELGFADDVASLKNQKSTVNTTQKLFAKFDSSNSFVTYNKFLVESMKRIAKVSEGIDEWVLYPETWGSVCTTYSIDRKMVPDRYTSEGKKRNSPVQWTPWEGDMEWMKDYKLWEEADKKNNVMPLREMFISTKLIKEAIKNDASNPLAILEYMFDKISTITQGIIELGISSNSYGQHSTAIIDKNTISAAAAKEGKSFLDSLLLFSPYSKSTIVKAYSLEYNMPEDGLGSQMAIESMGNLESDLDGVKNQSLKQTLQNILAFEKLNRISGHSENNLSQFEDKFIRYEPSVGSEAGRRHYNKVKGFDQERFKFDIGYITHGKRNKGINYTNFDKNKQYDPGQAEAQLQLAMSYTFDPESTLGDDDEKRVINVKPKQYDFLKEYHGSLVTRLQSITFPKTDKGNNTNDPEPKTAENENSKAAKEAAEIAGHTLVGSPDDYWMTKATKFNKMNLSVLIQLKANLTIQGLAGIQPGHIFRINYLPKSYVDNVYFQVTKVIHEIGDTWDTQFETVMRVHPTENLDTVGIDDVRVTLDYMTKILNLKMGKAWNEAIHNLEPVELTPNADAPLTGYTLHPKNIAAVFKTTLRREIRNFNTDFDHVEGVTSGNTVYTPSIGEATRVEGLEGPEQLVYAATDEFQQFLTRQPEAPLKITFPVETEWHSDQMNQSFNTVTYSGALAGGNTVASGDLRPGSGLNTTVTTTLSGLDTTPDASLTSMVGTRPRKRKVAKIDPTYVMDTAAAYNYVKEGIPIYFILHEDSDKWLLWPHDPTNDWVPLDKLLARWTEVPVTRQDTSGISNTGTTTAEAEAQNDAVESEVQKFEGTVTKRTEGIPADLDLYCQNKVDGFLPNECYEGIDGGELRIRHAQEYKEAQDSYYGTDATGESINALCIQCGGEDNSLDGIFLSSDDCHSDFCDYTDYYGIFLQKNICRPKACCYDLKNGCNVKGGN